MYRYKNKNFYNDRIRYHLYFLYFPNFIKKIKNLYGFKYFQYNFYNLYGFKYNFILNVRNKIKGELSLNLNPVNIFLTFNFINIYSNYYLFNNFVCLSYHLRKKIFSNKLFLSLYFQLIKNKLFFLKNKKLKKYNFFKYERFCNKYLSHNIFFKKKYYKYNYNNYRSRSFKIYSKIKYRYNYKLNVKPKILNLILFNVYNYYFKTLNFRKYIFKKYSKKLFLNNFKIKQRIQRIKPKKLKFIFKTYKKYRLLNFKLNNLNMKKINLIKILKFKNLISLNFKKNQNLLLFVTLIRGFSFDTTLNQFIVDIDYFSNKLFSLLSLFSIENVNSFGINLESMRSRSNFLVYNYFKTIKLNMFEKLYKNFKLLVKKKKII